MDMIITRYMIITRDEWIITRDGHDYYTWRMDMIITRDEWMWL